MPPENWLTRCGQLVSQWWAPLHFKLDLVGGLLEGFAIRETFLICFSPCEKHMKTSNSTDLTILTSVDDNCRYCKMTVRSSQVCQVMTNTSLGDEEPQWAMHRIDLFSVDLFWWKPLKTPGWSEQLVTVVQQFIHVYDGQSLQIMLFSMNSQVCLQHYRLKISLQDFDGLPVPAVAAVAVTTSIWLGFITGSSLKLPTIHNNFFSIIGLG